MALSRMRVFLSRQSRTARRSVLDPIPSSGKFAKNGTRPSFAARRETHAVVRNTALHTAPPPRIASVFFGWLVSQLSRSVACLCCGALTATMADEPAAEAAAEGEQPPVAEDAGGEQPAAAEEGAADGGAEPAAEAAAEEAGEATAAEDAPPANEGEPPVEAGDAPPAEAEAPQSSGADQPYNWTALGARLPTGGGA
eukprot:4274754-Prymnesium_polylepis.1